MQSLITKKVKLPPATKNASQSVFSSGGLNVAFIIDATASREESWGIATKAQTKILSDIKNYFPSANLGIYRHAGGVPECVGWFQDAKKAQDAMVSLKCISGNTNIAGCFYDLLQAIHRPKLVFLIGDCFEESVQEVIDLAIKNKAPVFSFYEQTNHDNSLNALQKFQEVSKKTNGACIHLNANTHDFYENIQAAIACVTGGKYYDSVKDLPATKKMITQNPHLRLPSLQK